MRGVLAYLGVVAIAALPSGLSAQASSPTPEEDLDCAVLFSVAIGGLGNDASEQDKIGLNLGLGYFAGRYEAARGDTLDTAMASATLAMTPEKLEAIQAPCAQRLGSMASRFSALSQNLQAATGQGEGN